MRVKHEPEVDGSKVCSRCGVEKPMTYFGKHPNAPDGRQAACLICERARMARGRHGLNADDKAAIATEQGGCAICGSDDPGPKGWVVDHDHGHCRGERSCDVCRRGILCHWCNATLGYARDSPEILRMAAAYLERHREKVTGIPGCTEPCRCSAASMCKRQSAEHAESKALTD